MKKSKSCKKVLEEILNSHDFDRLGDFVDASQWTDMSQDERELLGFLFVLQGEKQLENGDNKVFESFKLANKIVPNCPMMMARQALALADQTHNVFCLKASTRIYKKIVEAQPDFFDAWYQWGNVCVLLAIHSDAEKDFKKALAKFEKAEELSSNKNKEDLSGFYRDWGLLWYHFGKLSGEAFDFRQALKFYQKAIKLGFNAYDLWSDYGNCLIELSSLLNKPELIIEAVEMYWRSVRKKPDFFEGWMDLATSLKVLYNLHPLDAYYSLSMEAFEKAAKLEPQNGALWIKWGQLQAFRGKTTKDFEALCDSCQKYETADICESNHPQILSSWAESLVCIGDWTDDLEALRLAEEKIIKSLEIQPKNTRAWCLYGNCLNELGRYFSDNEYYYTAIEKYQHGLNFSPKDPDIWHGIAMAYFFVGQSNDDLEWFEASSNYCQQSIENGGHPNPQYWNDWGVVLMKLGMLTDDKEYIEDALNRFEQALRLKSNQPQEDFTDLNWLYNYGCAFDFLGDAVDDISYLEKAIQVLKKVIDIDPYFHHAYYNLSLAYIHYAELTADLDSYGQALKYMEAYLSLESEDECAWNEWGLALTELSQLIDDPSRLEETRRLLVEAEGKFLQARSLGSVSADYYLACLYSLLGNYSSSLHHLERAKEFKALPSIEELSNDEWLEGVRQTLEFQNFFLS